MTYPIICKCILQQGEDLLVDQVRDELGDGQDDGLVVARVCAHPLLQQPVQQQLPNLRKLGVEDLLFQAANSRSGLRAHTMLCNTLAARADEDNSRSPTIHTNTCGARSLTATSAAYTGVNVGLAI
jgi:hypothetical protein